MRRIRINKKKLILSLILLLLITVLLSLTIGRELMQGKQPGLTSFGIVHFAGYLFFILMPVEALFPYYLAQGTNFLLLFSIAVITAIVAQIIDYSIGFLFSERVINTMIGKEKYEKYEKRVEKYGNWAILLFNLFPLSSPIIILVAGMLRYKIKNVLIYSLIGLSIKYLAIYLMWGVF